MVKCRQVVKRSELHHFWNLHFLFFLLFFLVCLERTFAAVSLFVSGLRTGPTGPTGHPEKQVSRDVALLALPQNLYKALKASEFVLCYILNRQDMVMQALQGGWKETSQCRMGSFMSILWKGKLHVEVNILIFDFRACRPHF